MNSLFFAGTAVRDIMPKPSMVDERANSHLHPQEHGCPLKVKALAMTCEQQNLVLIAVDICWLIKDHCDLIRQSIADRLGISTSEVIISASHSHSTPYLFPQDTAGPYFELVRTQSIEAVAEAWQSLVPARFGHGAAYVAGASFNQRIPLNNGGVKFARDFREGLGSGRPIDPRLSVIRIDDENGDPLAGWVCFAAHPACVIFDAPISAEYPGYITDRLTKKVAKGVPVLFGYGASGDVNCVPMFGSERDSRNLGYQLAERAAEVFGQIKTTVPRRFAVASRTIELPLDAAPATDTLDKEIREIGTFIDALGKNPDLEWVLGTNCGKGWPIERKKNHVRPLAVWGMRMKEAIESGGEFPASWPAEVTALIIDELGLVFYPGEPLVELGLELAARSPLSETLLIAMGNGAEGYIGTADDRRRGGYETYTSQRYAQLADGTRPLPYAPQAAECLLDNCLKLIDELLEK